MNATKEDSVMENCVAFMWLFTGLQAAQQTLREQTRQPRSRVLDNYHPPEALEMHSKGGIFICLF